MLSGGPLLRERRYHPGARDAARQRGPGRYRGRVYHRRLLTSMASNYNRLPRPPIVMLRGGGEHHVAVRRESLEDLCRNDR